MENVATARMSTKGQVVIPEEIRDRLGLKAGAQFVVVAEDDIVILKTIKIPSMKDFDRLIQDARSQAKQAGMKRSDIRKALSLARSRT
jgi:AbrB family looped-hinge helix DNA binding protein